MGKPEGLETCKLLARILLHFSMVTALGNSVFFLNSQILIASDLFSDYLKITDI